MSEVKKCSCCEAEYWANGFGEYACAGWFISVPYDSGCCAEMYPVEYCPDCGQKLNDDGTTGKPYAELEAENKELKRRAAWYLSTLKEETPDTLCYLCVHGHKTEDEKPCNSCALITWGHSKDNFTPAPVPADFEVKENG